MRVFIDTSAFYAYLDADSVGHTSVAQAWAGLVRDGETLVTCNYVLAEAAALCQRRLGMDLTRRFLMVIVPAVRVLWVAEEQHAAAVASLLAAGRRDLSLVDCVSFEIMRRQGIPRAFTLDRHFAEQGFECMP